MDGIYGIRQNVRFMLCEWRALQMSTALREWILLTLVILTFLPVLPTDLSNIMYSITPWQHLLDGLAQILVQILLFPDDESVQPNQEVRTGTVTSSTTPEPHRAVPSFTPCTQMTVPALHPSPRTSNTLMTLSYLDFSTTITLLQPIKLYFSLHTMVQWKLLAAPRGQNKRTGHEHIKHTAPWTEPHLHPW